MKTIQLFASPFIIGIGNALLGLFVINPYTSSLKADEVPVTYFFAAMAGIWGFITVLLHSNVDAEWKDAEQALAEKNDAKFILACAKVMDPLYKQAWLVTTVFAIGSFHLLHLSSAILLVIMDFGLSFTITAIVIAVLDRDDPLSGIITIEARDDLIRKAKALRYWKAPINPPINP